MPETRPNIVLFLVDDADRKVLEHPASVDIWNDRCTGREELPATWCRTRCAGRRGRRCCAANIRTTPGWTGTRRSTDNFVANNGENDNVGVWFNAAGYNTAMIGKYLNGYKIGPTELDCHLAGTTGSRSATRTTR